MKLNKFQEITKSEAETKKVLLFSNLILVVLLAASLYKNSTEKHVVIMKANEYAEDIVYGYDYLSDMAKNRLSTVIASSMGNVTPENAAFQADVILSYAQSSIYQEVKDLINIQFEEIKKERISLDFTPERVFSEDKKTFVTGKVEVIGPTGIKKTNVRTYEFEWSVENYNPSFGYINVYNDAPRDSKWHSKINIKSE